MPLPPLVYAWLAVVLAACDPAPESLGRAAAPIVGGAPDSDFPAVAALTFDGASFCSGVLLAPRKVVTAAACLTDGGTQMAPADLQVFFGEQVGAAGQFVAASAITLHPGYSATDALQLHNLAVVTLAEDAPAAPLDWQSALLDVGAEVSLVGYGVDDPWTGAGGGVRRARGGFIDDVSTWLVSAGAGPCFGDLGGPMLRVIDAVPTVLGVLLTGDVDCAQYSHFTRLDAEATFLQAQFDALDAGAPLDAGWAEPDAGAPDSGWAEPDAGDGWDAGGLESDAGATLDAGVEPAADAGGLDAGSSQPDAGAGAPPEASAEPEAGGCGCGAGGSGLPSGAGALFLGLATLLRRRVAAG